MSENMNVKIKFLFLLSFFALSSNAKPAGNMNQLRYMSDSTGNRNSQSNQNGKVRISPNFAQSVWNQNYRPKVEPEPNAAQRNAQFIQVPKPALPQNPSYLKYPNVNQFNQPVNKQSKSNIVANKEQNSNIQPYQIANINDAAAQPSENIKLPDDAVPLSYVQGNFINEQQNNKDQSDATNESQDINKVENKTNVFPIEENKIEVNERSELKTEILLSENNESKNSGSIKLDEADTKPQESGNLESAIEHLEKITALEGIQKLQEDNKDVTTVNEAEIEEKSFNDNLEQSLLISNQTMVVASNRSDSDNKNDQNVPADDSLSRALINEFSSVASLISPTSSKSNNNNQNLQTEYSQTDSVSKKGEGIAEQSQTQMISPTKNKELNVDDSDNENVMKDYADLQTSLSESEKRITLSEATTPLNSPKIEENIPSFNSRIDLSSDLNQNSQPKNAGETNIFEATQPSQDNNSESENKKVQEPETAQELMKQDPTFSEVLNEALDADLSKKDPLYENNEIFDKSYLERSKDFFKNELKLEDIKDEQSSKSFDTQLAVVRDDDLIFDENSSFDENNKKSSDVVIARPDLMFEIISDLSSEEQSFDSRSDALSKKKHKNKAKKLFQWQINSCSGSYGVLLFVLFLLCLTVISCLGGCSSLKNLIFVFCRKGKRSRMTWTKSGYALLPQTNDKHA